MNRRIDSQQISYSANSKKRTVLFLAQYMNMLRPAWIPVYMNTQKLGTWDRNDCIILVTNTKNVPFNVSHSEINANCFVQIHHAKPLDKFPNKTLASRLKPSQLLAEIITEVSSADNMTLSWVRWIGKSFIKIKNNSGPNSEPWGTPI